MNCKHCGEENLVGSSICKKCGSNINILDISNDLNSIINPNKVIKNNTLQSRSKGENKKNEFKDEKETNKKSKEEKSIFQRVLSGFFIILCCVLLVLLVISVLIINSCKQSCGYTSIEDATKDIGDSCKEIIKIGKY